MTTIGDVARSAGVSRSTVSSVLTGRKFVTPATRVRVERAIRDLNFTVNSGARALATSRTMNIGLVFSIRDTRFVPSASTYVVALAEEARRQGYRLTLVTGADSEPALLRFLGSKSVDGLVLMEVIEDDPRVPVIRQAEIPTVLIGMPEDSRGVDAVDLDYEAAGRMALDQVHAKGNSHPALITWPRSLHLHGGTYARRFLSGARTRAEELDVELTTSFCGVDQASIRQSLLPLLRDSAHDALIFHNDALVPILPTLLLQERRPDLQVIGLCPSEMAAEQWLPFDTLDTLPEECARVAVQLLVQHLAAGSTSDDSDIPASSARQRVLLSPRLTPHSSDLS